MGANYVTPPLFPDNVGAMKTVYNKLTIGLLCEFKEK